MKVTELKVLFFSGLFVLAGRSHAQQQSDSAVHLRPVVIEQSSLGSYAINKFTLKVDSLTQQLASNGSLADLLRKYGFGHLRSYGPGGLATASFRGTGSSHTAVLWNGINLLSPLSGQLDLSHVPVSFIDDASIQTGGAASLYGNGSIGATIQLNNKASFNDGLRINTYSSAGSFQTYYQDAGVSWSGKRFITSTKVFLSDAKNDFKFLNKNSFPEKTERRDHTALHQKGLLQQLYWQPSLQSLFTLKFWYQDDSYQVPNATSLGGKAQAVELNTYYRTVAGWHYSHKGFDINYQGAYVKHDLNYTDPLLSLNSTSTFNTFINNIELNLTAIKNTHITSGINYTWEKGLVDDFGNNVPVRNRVALFGAVKWMPARALELAAAVREEVVNGNTKPVAPSLTAKVGVSKGLSVYASGARNYRIPTFNDLYWKGAGAQGNMNLRSELSLSSEAGFNYVYPSTDSKIDFSFKGDVFNNNVKNWIQWTPLSGSIWTPQNVKQVWSRGIESQAAIDYKVSEVIVGLALKYSFTKSTNEAVYEKSASNTLNKQLTYTPLHEGSATVRVQWKTYCLQVVNTYTGKQYTDDNNNKYYAMKAYTITNLWINKTLDINRVKACVIGEVNNLLERAYQSRPGYPMPGRNFKIGIKINFNKSNKV